jgi:cardiolipin synthase
MWRALPNLLTLLRIAPTPYILIELARGHYLIAGWTFGAAASTDVFDGMLARRFGAQSKTGQYLDPIADKILLTSLYIGLALGRAVPVWIVVLILTRDVWILLLSGIALRFTGFRELRPSIWGKASTFVQIMAAVCTIGARAYGREWFLSASRILLDGVVLLAVVSGADYTLRGIRYFIRGRAAALNSSPEAARNSSPR